MVLLGLFPVLPLKALVARKVIRERMDYESYLGGRVKEELDGLAGLAGRYVVEDAKLEVFDLKHGWKLVKAAWAWLKKEIPNNMKPFFNEKSEFCIIEKRKTGKKEWELQDINGTTKTLHLSNEVLRANGGCHVDGWMDGFTSGYWCCYRSRDGSMAQTNGGCHVFEQFVEDGNLIRWTCFFGAQ